MNALSQEKQQMVISALVEGSSIRSVERIAGIHRDTIMRLMLRIGQNCECLLDETMRGLSCKYIELDEIWCFVGKKQRHIKAADDEAKVGDQWVFYAIDAESKLIPTFKVGKRTSYTAHVFLKDLASRLDPSLTESIHKSQVKKG